MKWILTGLLFLSVFTATGQMVVDLGAGINTNATAAVNMELTYRFKKINLGTGYIVGITDNITKPDIFFLKAGKPIMITKTAGFDLGAGVAIQTYRENFVSKVDERYSYYKRVNEITPLLFVQYHQRLIKDAEFFTRTVYTGRYFYAGAGLTYVFKQKK